MGGDDRTRSSVRCVFDDIVAGTEPADVVFADGVAVAFLDRRPVFLGHTLVVPVDHVETLADLPPERTGPFFERVRLLSGLMETALDVGGTFVAMNNRVSQSVPHLHVHVIPRRRKDGLRGFFWPRQRYDSPAHAAEVAGRLRAAWNRAIEADPLPGDGSGAG